MQFIHTIVGVDLRIERAYCNCLMLKFSYFVKKTDNLQNLNENELALDNSYADMHRREVSDIETESIS